LNSHNYKKIKGASIYNYQFDNAYNDVSTKSPWPSAFGQAYVLKSLIYADEEHIGKNIRPEIEAASKAFSVDIKNGGIQTTDRHGQVFFEEVPNATHVLNAHLISINELSRASRYLQNNYIKSLAWEGINALRSKLHLFDTGYWLRYDQNPKKELLFKIDYLAESDQSPSIDGVYLENPQTALYTAVDVGSEKDFEGASRISGTDWREQRIIDGSSVRSFLGGGNAYLRLYLPDTSWSNYFDVPPHRLIIRYKDVAPGEFVVKAQSINSGESFIPLRGGVWHTTGDHNWKEVSFEVRPQDLGWFKGKDYQKYEVEQLDDIANLTNDWFFYQYAERHRHYLDEADPRSFVVGVDEVEKKPLVDLKLISGSPTYPEYSFENSLDSDPNNNYTAGIEGERGFVLLNLDRPIESGELKFTWESETNFPGRVSIRSVNEAGESEALLGESKITAAPSSYLLLKSDKAFERIRIDFSEFAGQPRILLRNILLKEIKKENVSPSKSGHHLINETSISLSVVKASETYTNHSFDNSLDGEPDNNYTAGLEGQAGFVVLKLSRKAKLSAVSIRWESKPNFAAHVAINQCGPDGSPLKFLGESENSSEEISTIPISPEREVEFLRIDFADFQGQPRVLVREIQVFEDLPNLQKESTSSDFLKSPFLSATDAKNPLHVFRVPISQRMKLLSDDLAKGSTSEHEMIMRFMKYIGRFRVGLAEDGSPDSTVTERLGACGSFTNTLLSLAASQNIDGRIISLLNYPVNDGHAIAELFVDGQWRVYDPTYVAFYYDIESEDHSPLSFDQLRKLFKTNPETVRPSHDIYRSGIEGFTGRDIFLKANPIGVIGPDKPMVFPLHLNMNGLTAIDQSQFGTHHQGANFIGAASANQNQKWHLSGLTPGETYSLILTPKDMGGDIDSKDLTFILNASIKNGEIVKNAQTKFDFSELRPQSWEIPFKAFQNNVTIDIEHPYRGPKYRYLSMQKYELMKYSAIKQDK
jgi:hypothetical protein